MPIPSPLLLRVLKIALDGVLLLLTQPGKMSRRLQLMLPQNRK
jgi:hypothetical protein